MIDSDDLAAMPEATRAAFLEFVAQQASPDSQRGEVLSEQIDEDDPSQWKFEFESVPWAKDRRLLVLSEEQALYLLDEARIRGAQPVEMILHLLAEEDAVTPHRLAEYLALDSAAEAGPYLGSLRATIRRLTGQKDATLVVLDPKKQYYMPERSRAALKAANTKLVPQLS